MVRILNVGWMKYVDSFAAFTIAVFYLPVLANLALQLAVTKFERVHLHIKICFEWKLYLPTADVLQFQSLPSRSLIP